MAGYALALSDARRLLSQVPVYTCIRKFLLSRSKVQPVGRERADAMAAGVAPHVGIYVRPYHPRSDTIPSMLITNGYLPF